MVTKPKPIIPSLDRDQMRQMIADREDWLSRPRDILLDFARSCRDGGGSYDEFPFPAAAADDFRAKQANVRAARVNMAKLHTGRIAENIKTLVLLLDDIPDPQRRKEAMSAVWTLIRNVRGQTECGMVSPFEEMLTKLGTEHARSGNPQPAEQRQRRELLRPHVKAMASEHASAKTGARIITLLLRGKDFREQFSGVARRRTLDADAEALLKEFLQT